jgi:hypothetical protein
VDDAVRTLEGFAVGKPVVVEETFPLRCGADDLGRFIDRSGPRAAGWFGFYWGRPPEELRPPRNVSDALTLGWLELFEREAKARRSRE